MAHRHYMAITILACTLVLSDNISAHTKRPSWYDTLKTYVQRLLHRNQPAPRSSYAQYFDNMIVASGCNQRRHLLPHVRTMSNMMCDAPKSFKDEFIPSWQAMTIYPGITTAIAYHMLKRFGRDTFPTTSNDADQAMAEKDNDIRAQMPKYDAMYRIMRQPLDNGNQVDTTMIHSLPRSPSVREKDIATPHPFLHDCLQQHKAYERNPQQFTDEEHHDLFNRCNPEQVRRHLVTMATGLYRYAHGTNEQYRRELKQIINNPERADTMFFMHNVTGIFR